MKRAPPEGTKLIRIKSQLPGAPRLPSKCGSWPALSYAAYSIPPGSGSLASQGHCMQRTQWLASERRGLWVSFIVTQLLQHFTVTLRSTCKSREGSAGFVLSSSPNRWWMWTYPKVNYKWVTDVYLPSWMNDYMRIQDLLASYGMFNSDHSLIMQKEPQIKQVSITIPVSFMQLTWVE